MLKCFKVLLHILRDSVRPIDWRDNASAMNANEYCTWSCCSTVMSRPETPWPSPLDCPPAFSIYTHTHSLQALYSQLRCTVNCVGAERQEEILLYNAAYSHSSRISFRMCCKTLFHCTDSGRCSTCVGSSTVYRIQPACMDVSLFLQARLARHEPFDSQHVCAYAQAAPRHCRQLDMWLC